MNALIVPVAALGAAALVAVTIVAPLNLGPALAAREEPIRTPPPFATEGQPAFQREQPAPSGPVVFFANLTDGAQVTSPVELEFGLLGMMVMPAGEVVEGTGHHHLLINTMIGPDALSEPIPADDQHIHFGGGQTRATIDLPPGRHRLQLLLADGNHVPHDPPVMSKPITITVLEEPRREMGVESRTGSWLMGRRAQ